MTTFSGSEPTQSGTIEFPCTGCGRTLKVPAAAAGKRASCPQCNTVATVPLQSAAMQSSSPLPPLGSSGAAPPVSMPPPAWSAQQHQAPQQHPAPPSPPPPAVQPASFPPPGSFQAQPQASSTPTLSPQVTAGRETPTKQLFDRITAEIGKIYVGQDELVLGSLVALFSSGHILIESVPGLGKTLFVRALGRVMGLKFGRIQFTADLMPSDVTGAPVLDMKTQEFRFRPGPIFTQLLLADEINRAPAKTHAALLEIMQEYRVTVDGKSHPIERPFLVLATQNPIESEGTYNLPEAQLDRFMFKLVANYPPEQEEAQILRLHSTQQDLNQRLETELTTITSPEEILRTIHENGQVRVDDRLVDYINKIVRRTREWPQFHMGASPRAGLALMQAARTLAAFSGRDYAIPDDVFQIALPSLRHRVALTAEAEVEGQKVDDLLTELIRSVEVPRL
jgi:MoxR-like ATPase